MLSGYVRQMYSEFGNDRYQGYWSVIGCFRCFISLKCVLIAVYKGCSANGVDYDKTREGPRCFNCAMIRQGACKETHNSFDDV